MIWFYICQILAPTNLFLYNKYFMVSKVKNILNANYKLLAHEKKILGAITLKVLSN